ncbi:MAG: LPS export ABC transporter ATP-binding protein [Deltaproteobacteria bacterium]|nr:LPS export ABC transporter ATP-binding protein [Deltaproteobacteria bacterium]MBW1930426.1 LPS export ABC transporter ATP-binding protein [Deltaproteobacteria bacterium]MBW2025357.1 LPS export ABC transporter ATP-binding protein [Deltaproteobacteria bacterium]MBW2125358.1 LPS export ABC transporter ATP-binding protein [Deltaproteobacteria bacterium]RLB19227.1 MAG: LPS export ABC transporter ATP-binding protein [Deltaproteobacteria bacterium]
MHGQETFGAEGLVKLYNGRRVVDQISIFLKRREVVGLLGPNGAGKTTTFYMMVGLTQPNGGRVLLDGEDITHEPMYVRARRGVTYLAQEPSVFRKLTVEENILAILEARGVAPQERAERTSRVLEDLNIRHLRKQKAASLSGGERRRLEITRALATEPRFMLLDEPFAGIDPLAVADLQEIIKQLKDRGLGIIITDHNVRETLNVCDRAYIIHQGRIVVSGSPEQIVASEVARGVYLGDDFNL